MRFGTGSPSPQVADAARPRHDATNTGKGLSPVSPGPRPGMGLGMGWAARLYVTVTVALVLALLYYTSRLSTVSIITSFFRAPRLGPQEEPG